MFQSVWISLLMSFSSAIQKQGDDLETLLACLEGYKHSIHIACIFDLDLERQAFLSNLFKFSSLNQALQVKNIEAVKTFLEVAHLDGNYFGDEWQSLTLCISQIDLIVSSGTPQDEESLLLYEMLSSQSMALLIDRLFSSSAKLNQSAILAFVRALCQQSWDEIITSSSSLPRMYSLQRIVEICHYNMKRIRVEWKNIWAIIGPHLNQVISHANPTLACFALDKLRQLSMKFFDLRIVKISVEHNHRVR